MSPARSVAAGLAAVAVGFGLLTFNARPRTVEANLFTVQGPIPTVAQLEQAATASKPAERIRPPDTTHVVVLGDSTGEFLGRSMAVIQGLDVDVWAGRRCPLRPDRHHGRFAPGEQSIDFGTTDTGAVHPGQSCAWSEYLDDIPNLAGSIVFIYAGPMMLVDFDDGNILTDRPRFEQEQVDLIEALHARDVYDVIIVSAPASVATYGLKDIYWADPARVEAWRLTQIGAATTADACWIDYATWAATQPDPRADGAHMAGPEGVNHAVWIYTQLAQGECTP